MSTQTTPSLESSNYDARARVPDDGRMCERVEEKGGEEAVSSGSCLVIVCLHSVPVAGAAVCSWIFAD
jgi:hypothetical protein